MIHRLIARTALYALVATALVMLLDGLTPSGLFGTVLVAAVAAAYQERR